MPRGAFGGGHLKMGAGSRPKSPMRKNLERLRDKKAGKKDEVAKRVRAAADKAIKARKKGGNPHARRPTGGTRPKP
ncbi:hypothetical protein CMI37_36400 [Candidatus Pacearchaeota archaeon]|nr:hypothetical protein [Candidatus Pacearchaeota archaeon]|tara:strand:- start:1982 stop:2209 length:228 start_codon:yes stop_codon:yes gene_type:complete